MAPATGTALVLLVAFVLPGFVTVLFQERTFKRANDPTPFDRLLQTIYYSVWCYVLLSIVALKFGVDRECVESLYERHKDAPAELVWRGALAILGPATVVWLGTLLWHESGANERVLDKLHLNTRHQQPTGWDFWFRKRFRTYVRIIYPDGRSVWGYYGEKSFASYAKDGRDLFLEYIYPESPSDAEDDHPWFGDWNDDNRGGWVRADDAICMEFYDLGDGEASSTPTEAAEARRPRRSEGASPEASTGPASTQEEG